MEIGISKSALFSVVDSLCTKICIGYKGKN